MLNFKNASVNSKILTLLVLAIVILLAISSIYTNSSLNKINYQEKQPLNEFQPPDSNTPFSPDDKLDKVDSLSNKNIINIILIGKDNTAEDGTIRSDSIIVASLNKKSKSIKLTSLMRDMYVPIPGHMDNRINAAYSLGGMDLLTQTVEENFGIEIEGCAEVDFSGFKDIIDSIGGIDIELNKSEAYYMSYTNGEDFTEGLNTLTGETALSYSRIRIIGNADYERTGRQRKVLVAIFDKVKNAGVKTILELADDIFPLVTTNLTYPQIISLATNVVLMGISDIETYRLPADGEFTETIIRDMDVLLPNISTNSDLVHEYIGY